ncbi:MAG: hypothetical protein HFI72_00125 [Peptococcaceae bacterium]|nr:hypothetical protein [Peptococcaceae bacterium]
MYHFKYVVKNEINPIRKELDELIHQVRNEVRNHFTFQYEFVGSVKRNMVTYDIKSNVGFDFDVNIMVNDDDENYSAKEIKHILMQAFNKLAYKYHYAPCENNTRVFTIKVKDREHSQILYSCDFAIVNNYGHHQQQYIRFNKKSNIYTWEKQPKGFYLLPEKIQFCKENNLWPDVRETYLEKKNMNMDNNKKSRSIFAEAIHQVCQQNGYFEN